MTSKKTDGRDLEEKLFRYTREKFNGRKSTSLEEAMEKALNPEQEKDELDEIDGEGWI